MSVPMVQICALAASITHDENDFQSADPQARRNNDEELIASFFQKIVKLSLDGYPVLTILFDCGASGSLPAQWYRTSFKHAYPCTCTEAAMCNDNVLIFVAGGAKAREALQFRRFGMIVEDRRGVPRHVQIDIRGGIVYSSGGAEIREELKSVDMLEKTCPFPGQVPLW